MKSSLETLKTFSNLQERKVQINLNRKPTKKPLCSLIIRKSSGFSECYLLALDAKPQHVLPVGNIWVFLNEVYISRQQELPAPVYPGHCHMLQELLHILWRKLGETQGGTCQFILPERRGRFTSASRWQTQARAGVQRCSPSPGRR